MSKRNRQHKQRNLEQAKDDFEVLVAFDYRVVQFSHWHFRVNERLDIWPSTKRWYDRKAQSKGTYNSVVTLVRDLFECLTDATNHVTL